MQPQITILSVADQKRVKDFVLSVWKEFNYVYKTQYDYDLDEPYMYYVESGGAFFLLLMGEQLIGTIGILKNSDDSVEFKRFYIDPSYRGKRYGSLLFDHAIAYTVKQGIKKIEFETDKIFTKAHLLYKKRGFEVFGENEEVYFFQKHL